VSPGHAFNAWEWVFCSAVPVTLTDIKSVCCREMSEMSEISEISEISEMCFATMV